MEKYVVANPVGVPIYIPILGDNCPKCHITTHETIVSCGNKQCETTHYGWVCPRCHSRYVPSKKP